MPSGQYSEDTDDVPVDMERPSPARIYDFWLGGSHNFASDRALGRRMAELVPTGVQGVWINRAFLRRAVQYLVRECGIRQFLDLGSGIPTVGNVHEIAQGVDPATRVVYVDADPVAVAHAHHILAGDPNTVAVRADLRDADGVFEDPAVAGTLDLSRPFAVLMIAVLHFLADEDKPAEIVRAYRERLVPGGYLAVSHLSIDPGVPADQAKALADYQKTTGVPFVPRTREQIESFFDGLELRDPGVVVAQSWRPDDAAPVSTVPVYVGVARKPA